MIKKGRKMSKKRHFLTFFPETKKMPAWRQTGITAAQLSIYQLEESELIFYPLNVVAGL